MGRFFALFRDRIFERFIKPVIISVSPIDEIALGVGIGVFIGLTPTVGIQMWIVFLIWLFFKYILGIRFDLIVGTALVWISNPLTMFFLYYMFLATGLFVHSILGFVTIPLDYYTFQVRFYAVLNNPGNSFLGKIMEGSKFLFFDLGLPMFVGSLFYAIPCSIISHVLTQRLLLRYRKKKAAKMGISYETWKLKYEKTKLKTKIK
ncbi:DUF2062 domain-containing protein [bacterium]|nr:DUF2062 domain-containing protein [bacterium]